MSAAPLSKVAIVGASGRIGGAFAKALLQTGKHSVTALTRAGSKSKLPAGVKVIEVDYEDEPSLVAALKGHQFLAISLGVSAAHDVHAKIVTAAGKAGVPYIMPNAYGYPTSDKARPDDMYTQVVHDRVNDVASNGVSSSIVLACGFWYEWSLGLGEAWFGFTIKDRKVTFFDDGKRVITVSTWDQCGRALAALLSLPESGASSGSAAAAPSVADFKGKTLAISSFRVSQRDMLDSLHRVLGTTDADWEITHEPTAKRVREGGRDFQNGDRMGFARKLYGDIFSADNEVSDYAGTQQTADKVLGLPREDLDEATRRTVEMVESGWNPFAV
ncbi:hypothetical protein C8A00DRAFT_44556 [Chaetomidium leptoderma]|uniref:NmrA-like domain-containing protein n=1 Tax=Chaetomidium leptoderma TaxID=669021 RepID=A0AAN6VJR7_9PEZI|nr:hypothetical protein C8A00DRAFT_44556 [Chaetomidium leptoderma]